MNNQEKLVTEWYPICENKTLTFSDNYASLFEKTGDHSITYFRKVLNNEARV
jgi:hypothetical protein